MAEGTQVPADMTVRERRVYQPLVEQQLVGAHESPAAVLAGYIARTALPWGVASDVSVPEAVRVSVGLLEEVARALMGLDAHLVRGIEDALANGERRRVSEREACAQEWVTANGFDKHGVAEWLRSGRNCG